MKNKMSMRRILVFMLTVVMTFTIFGVPVSALEGDAGVTVQQEEQESVSNEQTEGSADLQESEPENDSQAGSAEEPEEEAAGQVDLTGAAAGTEVTGTFEKKSGKDIATVRYYVNEEKTEYAFASVTETSSGYQYSFKAPYDGFTAVQGTSKDNANVVAQYYSTTKWDGAVDVSWYNESDTSFEISTPAQLAGLAAIVNGSINSTTPIYMVKGTRSGDRATDNGAVRTFDYDTPQTSLKQNMNEGLPDVIENKYEASTSLVAGVQDEAYMGLIKHDFANRTVKITADLDMGGVDGSEIEHSKNFSNGDGQNSYDYPNWTPIGGEYLMDPGDPSTMIVASFNGTLDGGGHDIKNVYCFRWSYRSVAETAYGYAQGTGLIGMMGSLYDGETNPDTPPAVRNMSLSGYFFGRRMVGGFVGCMGGGSNAASGTSVEGGIKMENLANHAYAYCTDSKGLGGIVACSMIDKGTIVNCYNDGNLETVYANPTGGIIGANEGMSIYCCYNTGKLKTNGNNRGRGIGCDSNGRNYKVSDCYYLEGCGDDDVWPGYYAYNLAKSVSVDTVSMTEKEMTDGTLLEKLNVNGKAYVAGDSGYPVLYWEKNSSPGSGTLTVKQASEGTIKASKTGSITNGTVVYLSCEPAEGWKCRYYKLNGNRLSGNYVTANGISEITGYYEQASPGLLKIEPNDICEITVAKNGKIKENDEFKSVENYPVNSGDAVYEDDFLMVSVKLKDGVNPEDEDLVYKAAAGQSNPFEYVFTYVDGDDEAVGEPVTTEVATFTVGSELGDDVSLSLDVKPLTCKKMWDYKADTSWYEADSAEFTLTTPEQLAGLSVLVDEGKSFSGKTVKLGADISLKNDDGTSGRRFWDGIGDYQADKPFAGTFDGAGHKITDYEGSANGLFEYCKGSSANDRAVVKNLEIWGTSEGQDACGFVARAENTNVTGCSSYCVVKGTNGNGHAAAIVGYATGNCSISDCVNYASVEGYGTIGGIVGELKGTCEVEGCMNKGNVNCPDTGGNYVGGIVGNLSGRISRSGNYGNLYAYGRNIGGIAGSSVSSSSTIDSCYNAGTITYEQGTSNYDCAGGIIGFGSYYKVYNSFNYGNVRKVDGDMPKENIGAIIGKDMKRSTNVTEDVYYLDTSCDYAQGGMTQNELDTSAAYSKGIKKASAADFADSSKVLAAVNDNSVFQLKAAGYPEIAKASSTHVHSGGTATCNELAVCDSCGLSYGLFSTEHSENKVTVGKKEAVWMTDGYSGDLCCKDCGRVLVKGNVITAVKDKEAIKVTVKKGNKEIASKTYSVEAFDSLKISDKPIGYSYGSKSDNIEAVTQYVTLETLLKEQGLVSDGVDSIKVVCTSTSATVSMDTLNTCSKYYENGNEYDAPAAFAIAWNTGAGSLETIAKEAKINGTIRFGYGMSKEQLDENAALGGNRLISPVTSVEINLKQPKVIYKAAEGDAGEELYLIDALDKANEGGGIITLQDDIDTGNYGFVLNAGDNTVVLDLGTASLSSNTENCITVKSGTLNIKGSGRVIGTLATEGTGKIAASGGVYTYEVAGEHCAAGYVPVFNGKTELYTMTQKEAYEAARSANEAAIAVRSLKEQVECLQAKVKLLDITAKLSAAPAAYNQVKLSWNYASDSGSEYDVIYKAEKKVNGSWQELNVMGNSYTDVTEPGIANEYRVAAGLMYKGADENKFEYDSKYVYASAKTALGKAAISGLTSKSKKLTVKWKAVSGATGYDVWIGTNSAVTKGLVKYSNVKSLSKTSKALKKKKYYYVKVRARVTNSKGTVVYGAWSTAKKIRCK
ncbi:MAG: hypothetical protein ACI4KL_06790 [Lentihominibacter sp.]